MAGGQGKIHKGHFSGWKRAFEVIVRKYPSAIREAEDIYNALPKVKIDICAETCPMFKKDKCMTLGIVAPINENCRAQEISQGIGRRR